MEQQRQFDLRIDCSEPLVRPAARGVDRSTQPNSSVHADKHPRAIGFDHLPRNLMRAVCAIGNAALLDAPEHWVGLPIVLEALLGERQRFAITYALLLTLDEDKAYTAGSAALFGVLQGDVL